jgi:hypothetical protein
MRCNSVEPYAGEFALSSAIDQIASDWRRIFAEFPAAPSVFMPLTRQRNRKKFVDFADFIDIMHRMRSNRVRVNLY